MKDDEPLNEHELIKRDQMAAARLLDDPKPSRVTEVSWLYAENLKGNYPKPTVRSGKWLLFVPNDEIDEVWMRVKEATEAGRLGGDSKVSTAKPNPNSADPSHNVICVYTYDSDDESDVMRVREELRGLGFVNEIPYKTDEATLSGTYRNRGGRNISRYYR